MITIGTFFVYALQLDSWLSLDSLSLILTKQLIKQEPAQLIHNSLNGTKLTEPIIRYQRKRELNRLEQLQSSPNDCITKYLEDEGIEGRTESETEPESRQKLNSRRLLLTSQSKKISDQQQLLQRLQGDPGTTIDGTSTVPMDI